MKLPALEAWSLIWWLADGRHGHRGLEEKLLDVPISPPSRAATADRQPHRLLHASPDDQGTFWPFSGNALAPGDQAITVVEI